MLERREILAVENLLSEACKSWVQLDELPEEAWNCMMRIRVRGVGMIAAEPSSAHPGHNEI
jgi:hypothetical protein